MDDREMKHLMDCMHSSAGAVISGHDLSNDPEYKKDPEALKLAQKCYDEGALRLAKLYGEFIEEIIKRRHETGNFQYPFEPFDEYPNAGRSSS